MPGGRRLALELLFVIVPYLVTATSYAMWWAGWSAPARFANPAVFLLAIPCAVLSASARHRATRVVAAAALAMTATMSALLVTTDGGRLAYNTRETTALWLDWASSLVPLAKGCWVYRGQERGLFARVVAIIGGDLDGAFFASRALSALLPPFATPPATPPPSPPLERSRFRGRGRRDVDREADGATLTGTGAARGAAAAGRRAEAAGCTARCAARAVDRATLLAMMRIEAVSRGGGGRGRDEQPMVSLPSVPAGRYRSARTARPWQAGS